MVHHIRNAAREAIVQVASSGDDKPIKDRQEARRVALEVGKDCQPVQLTFQWIVLSGNLERLRIEVAKIATALCRLVLLNLAMNPEQYAKTLEP
jgi:hypothetical protein